jgi:hypothetical protein
MQHGPVVIIVLLCGATAASAQLGGQDLSVELGDWHCMGPLKDAAFGIARTSFENPFAPEHDILRAGAGPIDLGKTYQVPKLPGMFDTERRWQRHPEWIDGHRHLLPRGPAPSRNESVYLYRTIHARAEIALDAVYRTEDFARLWLNGTPVAETVRERSFYGASRTADSFPVRLTLHAGENRLLVKHTSLHNAHGFAFNVPGLTGLCGPNERDIAAVVASTADRFTSFDRPYASAVRPPRDVKVALSSESGPAQDRLAEALALLRTFRFGITPVPMHDPPRLRMHELLEQTVPHTPEARGYLEGLAQLAPQVRAAMSAAQQGKPGADAAVLRAAEAVRAMWHAEIRRLPPMVFIRQPLYKYTAIGPYYVSVLPLPKPSSLCVFDPARPNSPPRVVHDEPEGAIYDASLSYDARTIFFSANRPGTEGDWHIYEIGVDGRGLRQLTRGPSANISPVLLPNGEIMFVSTRRGTYVQCQPATSGLLHVMDRDGSNVRRVSANIDSDQSPQVMDDGRVLFTRWDYGIEKNVFARHALWTMNPDGSGLDLFFGNTIEDPCAFWTAVAVPHRPEVVCVFGPHHANQAGSLGLVWNRLGKEAPRGEGFRWMTREVPSQGDLSFPHGYSRPWPIHECLFLCSYGGDGQQRNRLYLVDDRGNRQCIYEDDKLGCWNPLPLRPRKAPPVIAPVARRNELTALARSASEERTAECPDIPDPRLRIGPVSPTATVSVNDVYQGLEGYVRRGEARYIQIMEQVEKTVQRVGTVRAWGTVNPIIGRGTVHVKRVIGRVPIRADGSAWFTAPALKSVSFDVLDAEGKLLARMGSDMHLMPGEHRGCIGCHENRRPGVQGARPAAPRYSNPSPLAMRRDPSVPEQPDWGTNGIIDFPRVVQPVLDKYCVKCHSGPTPQGAVDLTGDKTRFFSMAYDNLIDRGLVDYHAIQASHVDHTTPRSIGSSLSRLCELIETDKHYGPPLPLADRQRIYCWIDANVPYYGTYEHHPAWRPTAGSRDGWDLDNPHGWFRQDLLPVFQRRCLDCHRRTTFGQGSYGSPAVEVTSRIWTDRALTDDVVYTNPLVYLVGPDLRVNLSCPEHSLLLTAPLAKGSGGLGLCRGARGHGPVFRDRTDPDYRALLGAIRQGAAIMAACAQVDMATSPEHLRKVLECEVPDIRVQSASSEYVGPGPNGKPWDRRAQYLVNDNGIFNLWGAGVLDVPDGNMWLTAGVGRLAGHEDRRPSVCLDLGQACDLALIRIWNYNEHPPRNARGVKDLEISFSADGRQWRSLGRFTLDRAPGSRTWPAGPHGCQDLFVAGRADGVRYVKLDIMSNHNGADYRRGMAGNDNSLVGLSELKFFRRISGKQPEKECRR